MTATYGTWLAILWWVFTVMTAFGMLLSMSLTPADAIMAVGCSGLAFTAFAALINLRDRP